MAWLWRLIRQRVCRCFEWHGVCDVVVWWLTPARDNLHTLSPEPRATHSMRAGWELFQSGLLLSCGTFLRRAFSWIAQQVDRHFSPAIDQRLNSHSPTSYQSSSLCAYCAAPNLRPVCTHCAGCGTRSALFPDSKPVWVPVARYCRQAVHPQTSR